MFIMELFVKIKLLYNYVLIIRCYITYISINNNLKNLCEDTI